MKAMNRKDVLIILPAFNEEEALQPILASLKQPPISDIADILVINDASYDRTSQIAHSMGVHVVSHVFHLGYGSALQLGYKYALRNDYSYIIQMDSDGQHDIKNVMLIYHALKTANEDGSTPDIVIGSRFLPGSTPFPASFLKKVAIHHFSRLIRRITGVRLTDPTSGLQGLSQRAFLHYSIYGNFDYDYPDANMLIQMLLLHFQIQEFPAIMHPRTTGKSMHHGIYEPLYYMLIMSMSIFHVRLRKWLHIKL
jgi:glycosyltransferase involved in cell wall biosynthesis